MQQQRLVANSKECSLDHAGQNCCRCSFGVRVIDDCSSITGPTRRPLFDDCFTVCGRTRRGLGGGGRGRGEGVGGGSIACYRVLRRMNIPLSQSLVHCA